MNRDYVVWNLKEAAEELATLIPTILADPNDDDVELMVGLTHLYHHVNTAWNARNATAEQVEQCSQDDFDRWRQFPADIEMV